MVNKGSTPSSKTLSSIVTAINNIGAPSANYVYYRGDLCYNMTGGWRHPTHSTYYGLSFNSDHIYLCTYNSTFPMNIMSEGQINFVNYNTMTIKAKITSDDSSKRSFAVYGCSSSHYDLDNCAIAVTIGTYTTYHADETNVTMTFSLSSVNSSYYLRMQAVLCNVRIYEILLS